MPATASITIRMTVMTMAVPRSGCLMTSRMGSADISTMRTRSRKSRPSGRRAQ